MRSQSMPSADNNSAHCDFLLVDKRTLLANVCYIFRDPGLSKVATGPIFALVNWGLVVDVVEYRHSWVKYQSHLFSLSVCIYI